MKKLLIPKLRRHGWRPIETSSGVGSPFESVWASFHETRKRMMESEDYRDRKLLAALLHLARPEGDEP